MKAAAATEKKSAMGLRGTAKDIEKPKRSKKIAHSNIAASIQELERNGLMADDMQKREEGNATAGATTKAKVEEGESPAKRSRHSPAHATPLTGAREEPRQEQ